MSNHDAIDAADALSHGISALDGVMGLLAAAREDAQLNSDHLYYLLDAVRCRFEQVQSLL